MRDVLLGIVALGVPLFALAIIQFVDGGISERHHSHHDTYQIVAPFSRALVGAMFFMGVTGMLLGWLCSIGVFTENRTVVLSFFTSFNVVLFGIWLVLRRYRVATFADRLIITPFVGASKTVRYADIERLEWSGLQAGTGYRNLRIYAKGRFVALLWGVLDIEQILLRMNRFDLLKRGA